MPAADAVSSTNTQCLVDCIKYMDGEAKDIVTEILLSSLMVINVPMLTSQNTADLFTQWYYEGTLREKLICIQPRAVYAERAKIMIENHFQRLGENIGEFNQVRVNEEREWLRSAYLWVTDPIIYMTKRGIIVRHVNMLND